jgi:hypothetical protein
MAGSDHLKLEEAQALFERFQPELSSLCSLLADLVEAGSRWQFIFMVRAIADLCAQAGRALDVGEPDFWN